MDHHGPAGAGVTATGRCGCGDLTYGVEVPPANWTYACHCRDCQAYSGSCFTLYTPARIDSLRVLSGSLALHHKERADGATSTAHFCKRCGTRLFSVNSHRLELAFLRAGTLDCASDLTPSAHMWTVRKATWLTIPAGAVVWPKSPPLDDFRALVEAALR
jgi:hypothetical protein